MSEARGKGELYAKSVHHDFVWKLRLTHPDRAEIRLDWRGRTLVFDPVEVQPGDQVILTSAQPDRIRGTAAAVASGQRPTVIADRAILDWLSTHGALGPGSGDASTLDEGVTVRSLAYVRAPTARPLTHFLKASIGALRPRAIFDATVENARVEPIAGVAPRIWELTLPDVGRFLHLDVALHRGTTPAWLDAAASYAGATWVLAGCPYGEADAVAKHLPRFGGKHILISDLVNGERRARGLPAEGVTPLRDRLHNAGLPAHVFATQASYRFE